MRLRRRGFEAAPHNRRRGELAEKAAANWLHRQGFEIRGRNVRAARYEIDLITREGETLCFVEVKARRQRDEIWALAAVGEEKQRRITRAAAAWLARHPYDGPCRFDVLILTPDQNDDWRFHLFRDAYQAVGEDSA